MPCSVLWSGSARSCSSHEPRWRAGQPSDGPQGPWESGRLACGWMRVGPCLRGGRGAVVELTEADAVRRVAMISVHTSPLDQPGTGDAGGLNVYVIELSRRLAAAGIEVDIFTRATSSRADPVVGAGDGITVRNIHAGPFEGLSKGELPGQLCVFAREVLRTEATK